jgi:hypothetical protein
LVALGLASIVLDETDRRTVIGGMVSSTVSADRHSGSVLYLEASDSAFRLSDRQAHGQTHVV